MFHRSFSCIEQLNAAYKRQEKTGLDHFSKRYLYMYYTDAHIRPRVNTTSTESMVPMNNDDNLSENPPEDYLH